MENESQKKINENTCKELYIKAHNIIKNAKIQKYAKEGEEIATQGITFFGGINGKNALQLEKMRNVKLRIELTQSQKPEFKDKYESKDIKMTKDVSFVIFNCKLDKYNYLIILLPPHQFLAFHH